MSKDITNQLNTFMSNVQIVKGQVSGDTVLPLLFEKDTAQGNDDNSVDSHQARKDKVHVLEGCLIIWSKQIKESGSRSQVDSITTRRQRGQSFPKVKRFPLRRKLATLSNARV